MQQVFAMDIGGTHTRWGFVQQSGDLSCYESLPTQTWAGTADPLSALSKLISDALNQAGDCVPLGLSLGFPAAIDKDLRTIINAPAIPALDMLPIRDLLAAHFNLPVWINRDVVMLYEHAAKTEALPRAGTTLGFFIGTGIGFLIARDGVAFNGAHGMAGELGHIPLAGLTGRCGCGNRGCAELYTAGRALAAIARRYYPGEPIGDLFTNHPADAPLALYLSRLAQLIAGQITVFDPDTVLLGGGVVHMEDFPLKHLQRAVASHLRKPLPAQSLHFYVAQDAQQAGVIGAGLYAWRMLA